MIALNFLAFVGSLSIIRSIIRAIIKMRRSKEPPANTNIYNVIDYFYQNPTEHEKLDQIFKAFVIYQAAENEGRHYKKEQ